MPSYKGSSPPPELNPIVINPASEGREISADGIEKILTGEPSEVKAAVVEALKKTRVLKLTDIVNKRIADYGFGDLSGLAHIWDLHTTTGFAVNEYESMLLKDVIWRAAKKIAKDGGYLGHDDHDVRTEFRPDGPERINAAVHVKVFFEPKGVFVPVHNGELLLRRYQSLIYVDFDAIPPQERFLHVTLIPGYSLSQIKQEKPL
ncbi:MAG: YjbQ family protein [Candidatus Woesearchaeota archaeon]